MSLLGLSTPEITAGEQAFMDFKKRYPEYGRTHAIDKLRKQDFNRLDIQEHTYLDYTGGHLYPKSLLDWHQDFLKSKILGNPHSQNPSSTLSEKYIHEARRNVLDFFNCQDDYLCIFTSNASAAVKIVGECYPFDTKGELLLTADNHNSVNGLREYARAKGASFQYSCLNQDTLTIDNEDLKSRIASRSTSVNKLLAFPAQSNVSGVQHDLRWIEEAHRSGWDVLLDAAAFVPASPLDLQKYRPEFVCISFYKMFGYPTGLGCLLVKKSAFKKLAKPSFSGGTITIVSVLGDGHYLHQDEARFEDGTVDYLNIPVISKGLEYIQSIGFNAIKDRVDSLTSYLYHELLKLTHSTGSGLIKIHGPDDFTNRGGTLALNFFDCNGKLYNFLTVEKIASDWNISLRTGCFCNPGLDESNHQLTAKELRPYFEKKGQKDYFELIQYLGKSRGAVRVSIGYITNFWDIARFLQFCRYFLDKNHAEMED